MVNDWMSFSNLIHSQMVPLHYQLLIAGLIMNHLPNQSLYFFQKNNMAVMDTYDEWLMVDLQLMISTIVPIIANYTALLLIVTLL